MYYNTNIAFFLPIYPNKPNVLKATHHCVAFFISRMCVAILVNKHFLLTPYKDKQSNPEHNKEECEYMHKLETISYNINNYLNDAKYYQNSK